MEYTTVLAQPCGDRFGRLHNEIDQQLLPTATRAAIPTLMTLTSQDWIGNVEIERNPIDNASIVDLSGVSFDGTTPTGLASLSPGAVYRHYGNVEVIDRLALYDQARTNTLCGMVAGWKNNNWPRLIFNLASNDTFADIAPYQYYGFTLSASESPRGVAYSGRIIPRSIRREYNGSYALTSMESEAESFEQLAITHIIPDVIPPPDVNPPLPILPPVPVPIVSDAREAWFLIGGGSNGYKVAWYTVSSLGEPTWNITDTPTDFLPQDYSLDRNSAMQITLYGEALYINGMDHANGDRETIWKLDNLSAIRLSPATAPSWSVIAYSSQVVSIGTLRGTGQGASTWPMIAAGSNLYAIAYTNDGKSWYSIYNGTAWTYSSVGIAQAYTVGVNKGAVLYYDTALHEILLKTNTGSAIGAAFGFKGGMDTNINLWGVYNGVDHYYAYTHGDNNIRLRHMNDNTEYDTGDAPPSNRVGVMLGGAYGNGLYSYAESALTGKFFISSNAAAYSLLETFTTGHGGLTFDMKLVGGGALLRVQHQTDPYNVFLSINGARTAGTWVPMNGDIATKYPWTGAQLLTVYSFGLVF
jgi:hypothetical protein